MIFCNLSIFVQPSVFLSSECFHSCFVVIWLQKHQENSNLNSRQLQIFILLVVSLRTLSGMSSSVEGYLEYNFVCLSVCLSGNGIEKHKFFGCYLKQTTQFFVKILFTKKRYIFLALAVGSNPARPYPNPFSNPAGKI